jgi:hypothetical protein
MGPASAWTGKNKNKNKKINFLVCASGPHVYMYASTRPRGRGPHLHGQSFTARGCGKNPSTDKTMSGG